MLQGMYTPYIPTTGNRDIEVVIKRERSDLLLIKKSHCVLLLKKLQWCGMMAERGFVAYDLIGLIPEKPDLPEYKR